MTKLHIKKNDTVVVLAGADKGKTGKVLSVLPKEGRVVVEGVNIISRHKKPRNAQDKGGIMKAEGKISASNVQLVCPSCKKATRVAHKTDGDKKVRVCKKCGAVLDTASAKKTAKAAKPAKSAKSTATKEAKKEVKETKQDTKVTKAVKDTTKKSTGAVKTKSVSKSTRRVSTNG